MSRVRLEADLTGVSDEERALIVGHAEKLLAFLHDTPYTHPVVASLLHRSVYYQLNNLDPFAALKEQSDKDAKAVLMQVKDELTDFSSIVTAAVIGNIFDYGVKGHTIQSDFLSFFRKEFSAGLLIDDTDKILPLCKRVVYFTDNCGEIIFDQVLIRFLKNHGAYITLVVRDAPILNDVTMEEIRSQGLDMIVDEVFTGGGGAEIGIRFDLISDQVRQAIDSCTLIISKGMANYESIREEEGLPPVAYLLAAKCDPIAEELGVPRGAKLALLRT